MRNYKYTAIDGNGKETKGLIEGENLVLIREKLREKGLIPIDLIDITDKKPFSINFASFISKNNINTKDLTLFTRQLSTLIDSGIPIEESLSALIDHTEKQNIKDIISQLINNVREGYSLADSMRKINLRFPQIYTATIASGEQSGHLAAVLNNLADFLEKKQALKYKLLQAFIYPTIMLLTSFGIISFLLIWIVPKMVDVFISSSQQLPILTVILINISELAKDYGILIIFLLCIISLIVNQLSKKPKFQLKIHKFILKLPLIGKFIKIINTTRFTQTLGMLTSSGVPVIEAFKISSELITNITIKDAIGLASQQIKEGAPINKALKESGFFPAMTIHFIGNGEASGRLEEMLIRAADHQESYLKNTIDSALVVFEPLLILFMGGIVLFIVLAILVPIFDMTHFAY